MDESAWRARDHFNVHTEPGGLQREHNRTELALTKRVLDAYLPPSPAVVLVSGEGSGRYANYLAGRGDAVTLLDSSKDRIDTAARKSGEIHNLVEMAHGSGLNLGSFPDESFDAFLLMGPLYHLPDADGRQQALRESYRILRPGGVLFAERVPRYAPLRWAAKNDPREFLRQADGYRHILNSGMLLQSSQESEPITAYYALPGEVETPLRQEGFEVLGTYALEGMVSLIDEGVNVLDGDAWQAWEELNFSVSRDPSLAGSAEHILVVAVKPVWKSVVRRLAAELNAGLVPYKVVSGTSIALQGVPIPVKDIDIETDADSAYRIQDLFPRNRFEAVHLSDNGVYRSHFGRFEFDGVKVDVMGDLHRLEGEQWVPTRTQTQTVVELQGVPVNVSWLEEETVAYIRRGKLERAAECLRLCQQDRLLALLRGDLATQVI